MSAEAITGRTRSPERTQHGRSVSCTDSAAAPGRTRSTVRVWRRRPVRVIGVDPWSAGLPGCLGLTTVIDQSRGEIMSSSIHSAGRCAFHVGPGDRREDPQARPAAWPGRHEGRFRSAPPGDRTTEPGPPAGATAGRPGVRRPHSTAILILGETAGVHRFRSKDAYARFTGTAPDPGLVRQPRTDAASAAAATAPSTPPAHDRPDPGPRRRPRQGLRRTPSPAPPRPAPKPCGYCAGDSPTSSSPPYAPTSEPCRVPELWTCRLSCAFMRLAGTR